jgi:transposase-like protein
VTIATSLGNRSLTNAYSVEDASGYDCHLCGGHFNPMSHSACEAETGEASSPR